MKNYTIEQKRWLKLREAYRENDFKNCHGFQNLALTVDGSMAVGLTKNNVQRYYSCTYLDTNGVRDFGGGLRWDFEGGCLDNGADLNLKTVHESVNKIG